MTHDAEVTRLGATNLGSEVPGRAQQGSLGGVDVAGTSTPEYMTPSSTPCILASSMHSKTTAKFPWSRLLSFVPPLSQVFALPSLPNLLNQ